MISTAAISNRHLGIVVLARQLRMRWNLHYPRLQRTILSGAIRVYPDSLG